MYLCVLEQVVSSQPIQDCIFYVLNVVIRKKLKRFMCPTSVESPDTHGRNSYTQPLYQELRYEFNPVARCQFIAQDK